MLLGVRVRVATREIDARQVELPCRDHASWRSDVPIDFGMMFLCAADGAAAPAIVCAAT